MTSPIRIIVAAAFAGLPVTAAEPPANATSQQNPQPPPASDKKALSPELAALLRFKPKSQKDAPKSESRVVGATRSGGGPPINLVALAPAAGGITTLDQPRLWWWQSADTAAGEMEFVLTRLSGRPQTILAIKLGPMKAGYNAIDLSNPSINPTKARIDPSVEYQWTLGCFSQLEKDSVFVRMRRADNPTLSKLVASERYSANTLTLLSDSGNWYELFDTVAFPSRLAPENPDLASIRARLLEEIGLARQTKP